MLHGFDVLFSERIVPMPNARSISFFCECVESGEMHTSGIIEGHAAALEVIEVPLDLIQVTKPARVVTSDFERSVLLYCSPAEPLAG